MYQGGYPILVGQCENFETRSLKSPDCIECTVVQRKIPRMDEVAGATHRPSKARRVVRSLA